MAIEMSCPHCGKKYKLRDDLAGKKVSCKAAECLKPFHVPAAKGAPVPAGNREAAPPPAKSPPRNGSNGHIKAPDVDADALALAALADEAPPAEVAAAPEGKPIPLTCVVCDHRWEVKRDKEGKNVQCPECRTLVKVPIQIADKPKDWRTGPKGPSLAKQEELEGAWDAGKATYVGTGTLEAAGAIIEEEDPVPLAQRLKKYLYIAAGVAFVAFAGLSIRKWKAESTTRSYMAEAVEEFNAKDNAAAKRPLWVAALRLANAEHMILAGIDNDEDRTKAFKDLQFARNAIRDLPPTFDRNRLLIAIAVRMADLGGDKEAVREEEKVAWRDVQTHMRQTLAPLAGTGSDDDTRLDAVREIARALGTKKKADVIKSVISDVSLAAPPGMQAEMLATAGVELLKAGLREPAEAMFTEASQLAPGPTRSLQSLAMGLEKKLPANRGFSAGEQMNDDARAGIAMGHALKGDDAKAKEVAELPGRGTPAARFRALVMAARVLPAGKSKPLLDAAAKLALGEMKPKPKAENPISPTLLAQVAKLLALQNDVTNALNVADTIADARVASWARYEVLAARLEASPGTRAEEVWLDKLGDPADVAVAMAHLTTARRNEEIRDGAVAKVVEQWPAGSLRPFGLAGQALGRPHATPK